MIKGNMQLSTVLRIKLQQYSIPTILILYVNQVADLLSSIAIAMEEWEVIEDSRGVKYYHNTLTSISTLDKPDVLKLPEELYRVFPADNVYIFHFRDYLVTGCQY